MKALCDFSLSPLLHILVYALSHRISSAEREVDASCPSLPFLLFIPVLPPATRSDPPIKPKKHSHWSLPPVHEIIISSQPTPRITCEDRQSLNASIMHVDHENPDRRLSLPILLPPASDPPNPKRLKAMSPEDAFFKNNHAVPAHAYAQSDAARTPRKRSAGPNQEANRTPHNRGRYHQKSIFSSDMQTPRPRRRTNKNLATHAVSITPASKGHSDAGGADIREGK